MINSIKILLKPRAGLVDNVIYLKGLKCERQQSKGQKPGELEASI